jgi:hypothetical protein
MRIIVIVTFVLSLFGNLVNKTVHAVVENNAPVASLSDTHEHDDHDVHSESEHVHNCENCDCNHFSQLFFSHPQIKLFTSSIQQTLSESVEKLFYFSSLAIDRPPRF